MEQKSQNWWIWSYSTWQGSWKSWMSKRSERYNASSVSSNNIEIIHETYVEYQQPMPSISILGDDEENEVRFLCWLWNCYTVGHVSYIFHGCHLDAIPSDG